jgi:hypothetical protein
VQAQPRRRGRARALVRAVTNTVGSEITDAAVVDGLLEEIRAQRRAFPADEYLAHLHAMALANASFEPKSDDDFERNERLLLELRNLTSRFPWKEYVTDAFEIDIMGNQYLGLVQRRRYEQAESLLTTMAELSFDHSQSARVGWFSAVRIGFWILLDQGELARIEGQIERVREYRRRRPDDVYEAPETLLAMLLGDFAAAERRGDTALSDLRFEEACSVGDAAKDCYGHVERSHAVLSEGVLGEPARARAFAERLAAIWHLPRLSA